MFHSKLHLSVAMNNGDDELPTYEEATQQSGSIFTRSGSSKYGDDEDEENRMSTSGLAGRVSQSMARLANSVRKGGAGGLETRIRRLSQNVSDPPEEYCNWITKKSRNRNYFREDWKRRYAKLQSGYIRYYAQYDMELEEASNEKGSVFLGDCFVEDPIISTDPATVYISLSTLEGQFEDHLIFSANDEYEALEWRKYIRLHIEYAGKLAQSTHVQVKGSW